MLEFIRRHSQSLVVKIFLSFLAFSFVLFFGISTIIQKLAGKDYVVKIGKVKISPYDLKSEKARRIGMLRSRMIDIDEKDMTANILHQLIWENIVDQAALEYGIIISDETMKRYISGMSMFRDKDGRFNANLLRGFLQQIQMPEAMFLESSKKDIKNALIKTPFVYISVTPELEYFTQANLERRNVTLVELRPNSFKITEKPTQEMLEEFFNSNPDLFTVDETRSFRVLELTESSLEGNIQVTEDDIRDAYDHSPEKDNSSYENMKKELEADLRQEKLQSEANEITRQIEDALMAGDDVNEVAKKFNLNITVVEDVNTNNKSEKSDDVVKLPYKNDVLSIAFSVDEGADSSFSEAIDAKGNRLYWLLHVDSITPKHVAAFEKSSDKALDGWIAKQQRERAEKMAADFFEKIKTGDSLNKLAAKSGCTSNVTQQFDRFGKLSDEKNTKFKDIISEIYEDVFILGKAEANYKEINGKFVVYQVNGIVSPKEIDKKDEAKYQKDLRTEIIDDMYQQLVGYLSKKKYEVKINHDLLKEINEEVDQNTLNEIF
ncbi:MAG: SurA N-terminal domain-containing protein [Holosporaceae bacterium]|nr:SurA N-terminal domain-containing protein [Holosporaceae bacterium]